MAVWSSSPRRVALDLSSLRLIRRPASASASPPHFMVSTTMQSRTFFITVLCGGAAGLLTPPPAAHTDALARRTASPGSLTRRALLPAGLAAAVWPAWASAAPAALELETRTAKAYSVSYSTPPAWPLSEQELSDSRYLYVATDPDQPDSANVVLTIQPLRADYSALGSFGTIGLVGSSPN